jgi:hypothetical protein
LVKEKVWYEEWMAEVVSRCRLEAATKKVDIDVRSAIEEDVGKTTFDVP